jgi:hypothetical protein
MVLSPDVFKNSSSGGIKRHGQQDPRFLLGVVDDLSLLAWRKAT